MRKITNFCLLVVEQNEREAEKNFKMKFIRIGPTDEATKCFGIHSITRILKRARKLNERENKTNHSAV